MVWLGYGLAGFFGGAILAFTIGMLLPMVIRISQAEGAYAMGVAFVWTPLGALVGAVIGLIVASGRA